MCIAVIKPEGVALPSKETLARCFRANPDGGGFTTYDNSGKTLMISKGYFDFEEYYKRLVEWIDDSVPALIHMRIATHGNVDAGNCHPFPFTNSYKEMRLDEQDCLTEVMVHNGILSIDPDVDHVSDTMTFTKSLKVAGIDPFNEGSHMLIDRIVSSNNKVAFMRNDGTIVQFGNWIEAEDGCSYSNNGYEGVRTITRTSTKSKHTTTPLFGGRHGWVSNYVNATLAELKPSAKQLADLTMGCCPVCEKVLSAYGGSCFDCDLNFREMFFQLQDMTDKELLALGLSKRWEDTDGLWIMAPTGKTIELPSTVNILPHQRVKKTVDNVNSKGDKKK